MKEIINNYLKTMGLPPLTGEAEEKFAHFSARLREENEKYNLTAITEPDEVALRHFADSLTLVRVLPDAPLRLADVGCGGGFPGLPLKIYLDSLYGEKALSVTMLDATEKKVAFIGMMCEEMNIHGVEALQGRAEELGHEKGRREAYDGVISRAVAAMDKLDELCLPLCKVGGFFACLKSAAGREETAAALKGIKRLGGGEPTFTPYCLGEGQPESLLVSLKKISPTPEQYPRAFGAIKKKPL